MDAIELYDNFKAAVDHMHCGVILLDVIYECMRQGVYDAGYVAPALYAAYDYFSTLEETLRDLLPEVSPQKQREEETVEPILPGVVPLS